MSGNLYAWADPNAGTSNAIYYLSPFGPMPVIYTKTPNPDTSVILYDENENVLNPTFFSDDDGYISITGISSATTSSIKFMEYSQVEWNCWYNRDSSRDILVKYVSNISDGTTSYLIKDSEARTALAGKQDTLVSGTNIKTINSTNLLGSGNISIDGLPSQSGQSGKVLTTNGTNAAWADIPTEIPSQAGNSGKFLKTNGTAVSWARGVENLSLQTDGLTVFGTPSDTGSGTINIGPGTSSIYGGIAIGLNAQATGNRGVAIAEATSAASTAVAIGYNAKATATDAVQLGAGTNANTGTLQFKSYQLLDTSGMIPEARLASTGSAVQGQALVLDSGLDAKWTTLKVSDLTDDSDFAAVTFRAWGAGE